MSHQHLSPKDSINITLLLAQARCMSELIHTLPEHKFQFKAYFKELNIQAKGDNEAAIISGIKTEVIKWIQEYNFNYTALKFSVFIETKLGKDYTYLSNLFSDVEGQTIEQYLILQRIEKVKELLVYDELSLNEIAVKTGFSSGSHLSMQFKKVTGLTPSHFRQLKEKRRTPIEEIGISTDIK